MTKQELQLINGMFALQTQAIVTAIFAAANRTDRDMLETIGEQVAQDFDRYNEKLERIVT